MRSSSQSFVVMLRPFAVRWGATGPLKCTCSFSGARTPPPHSLALCASIATAKHPQMSVRTSCFASLLGCNGPAPALQIGGWLTCRSSRQRPSSTAKHTALRRPTERATRAAAGSDAASAAREIGRRAAERVKGAEPQLNDNWGDTADRERPSSAQPSSSRSGGEHPPGGAMSSGRGAASPRASAAGRITQQPRVEDGPVPGGDGDSRARRYLARIAGLKAVPEDYNRDVLPDDWMETSTAPAEAAAAADVPAQAPGSAAVPDSAEHSSDAAQASTSAGSAAALSDDANLEAGTVTARQPSHTRVKSAKFVKSSTTLEQCPPASLPELAVIGRSNVGKSSLVNALTNQSSLAKVSKTPGKTTCINHFLINDSWYLVDLPGYGYARRSKEARLEWGAFTQAYFLERQSLAAVLLLVDASVPPQELDMVCVNWLAEAEVPFALVYTKMDKRKKRVPSPDDNIAAFEEAVAQRWEVLPPSVRVSAHTGAGKAELLLMMAELRELYKKHSSDVR